MSQGARRARILAAVGATQLVIILTGSIVNVALPSLQKDLRIDLDTAGWVITAYAIAFGGCLLLGGRITDRIGGGRAFLLGMAVFVIASIATGLATNAIVLISARAVQGVSASLVAPAGLSLLYATFLEPRDRMRALGVYGLMATCGGALGLVVGGLLTSLLSWRWCFFIVVPIAITALLIVFVDARGGSGHPVRIGVVPAILLTASASGLTLAAAENERPLVWIPALGASALAVTLFVIGQSRARETFIPRGLFRAALPRIGLVGAAGASFVMMASGTMVSLVLQDVLGLSAFETGFALLITPASIAVGTTVGARALTRRGPYPLIVLGLVLIVAGCGVLSLLRPDSSFVLGILPALTLTGLGQGLVGTSTIAAVLAGALPGQSGIASAGQQMMQQIFGAVGFAVLFAVSAGVAEGGGWKATDPDALVAGVAMAQACGGVVAIAAVILIVVLRPRAQAQ